MLHSLIQQRKNEWIKSDACSVRPVVDYIRSRNELRPAQIDAIETWLYLKIAGENKPLWRLFADGFFNTNDDLSKLRMSQPARQAMEANPALRSLYEFARLKTGGNTKLLPELEEYILERHGELDALAVCKKIFYGVDYTDYLFSLPMGAGKTFLMAAFIYLDLYFSRLEPDNSIFARNFIILVPSGLKSSIIPSLKTIETFNPSWVIPEPAASDIKRLITFEVLDQPKSAKKSNRARNPNAQKIAGHQPFADLLGLVLVVNAEKVILDRLDLSPQLQLIEHNEDEKDRWANELRNLIGKIPNLSIHIDEVHHAATDDIKLRQVVNRWNDGGSINSVIGYSGTPYLSSPEKIAISDAVKLKFSQITNTVHYYPLIHAIQTFLKKPRVEVASGLEPLAIIERGIRDFHTAYWQRLYADGTCAKLAIYCGSILRLEEEIYPFVARLVEELGGNPSIDILKYHKGNKEYKLPKESDLAFTSLDLPLSRSRIVLLVQVGKEGWDCRSLTGVILAQKGDSPNNMVLQTSCRCLRQVDKGEHETAIVWLNEFNAKTLNAQLQEEQQTSIAEINRLGGAQTIKPVERFSRLERLNLPPVEFYQLKVEYEDVTIEDDPRTLEKLAATHSDTAYFNPAVITQRGLNPADPQTRTFVKSHGSDRADFQRWLGEIAKEGFNPLTLTGLLVYEAELQKIFQLVIFVEGEECFFNELYDQLSIRAAIRLAFHKKRELRTQSEIIPESAQLLLVDRLKPVAQHDKLYPDEAATTQIRDFDNSGKDPIQALEDIRATLRSQGMGSMADGFNFSPAVAHKDRSFHYLPYDFRQSGFELAFLQQVLSLQTFQRHGLEIYYNGERHLTSFKIQCFARTAAGNWKRVGEYTPDFLIIQRRETAIYKVMIVETKGSGFAEQSAFKLRKRFMETEFLHMNNEKFEYERFDYLYLADDQPMDCNLATLNSVMTTFFKD